MREVVRREEEEDGWGRGRDESFEETGEGEGSVEEE